MAFKRCGVVAATLLGLIGFGFAGTAGATTLTLDMSVEFSGGTPPAGGIPWVTATFDDSFGGANTVRLTISNTNLTGDEFNAAIYLNFDPNLDASLLTFTAFDNSASGPNSVTGLNDDFMADGDGFFDILFDMPPPPGDDKFSAGESIIYDLTYTSAITAGSFDYGSVLGGGNGSFLAAAHIQETAGGESGWVGAPIPEPSTALLLGLGLVGLSLQRRRSA